MVADVGPSEAFAEGDMHIVSVGKREIGVVRWQGELFAIRNLCPHMLAPVCAGTLVPRLTGPSYGVAEPDPGSAVLVCPWHRWEYDLRSGYNVRDRRYRLKTYQAWEQAGRVKIRVGGQAAAEAAG